MRKKIVAGNWKQNGSRVKNQALISGLVEGLDADSGRDITANCVVLVCPPFVYLGELAERLSGSAILLGAQNVSAESSGAFTGEVSAGMISDVGCTHVIVGHSERRELYGDTDEIVARKFGAAHAVGLSPILCVGESLEQRESGVTMAVIETQVNAVLDSIGVESFSSSIIAYEPIWAIGTGLTASPEQAQDVHAHIRSIIAARDAKIADSLRILYGGSVKGSNAAELFSNPDIDGGLIGGASLDAADFLAITKAAAGID